MICELSELIAAACAGYESGGMVIMITLMPLAFAATMIALRLAMVAAALML